MRRLSTIGIGPAQSRNSAERLPSTHVIRLLTIGMCSGPETFVEASGEARTAAKLDPLSPILNAVSGWPFYWANSLSR